METIRIVDKRGDKFLVMTYIYFNPTKLTTLFHMMKVLNLTKKYKVNVGQLIGEEVNNAGMIAYQFLVHENLLPNHVKNLQMANKEPDVLNGEVPEAPMPKDEFIKELEFLYETFYQYIITTAENK